MKINKKTMSEQKKEEKLTFIERLQKARSEIKVPKNRDNKYGGFSYRKAEDILREVNNLLPKYDLEMEMRDSIELIGDRYYIKHTVVIHDIENYNTNRVSHGWAREPKNKKGMDEPQITGTASSYAKKRALANMFHIDEEKDIDEMKNGEDKKSNLVTLIEKKIKKEDNIEELDNLKDNINKSKKINKKDKQDLLDKIGSKKMKIKSEQEDDGIPVVEDDES